MSTNGKYTDIWKRAIDAPEKSKPVSSPPLMLLEEEDDPGDPLADLKLKPSTRDFIANGAPEGTRNSRLYDAAFDMMRKGYPKAEIIAKLKPIALKCGLPETEVDCTLKSATSKRKVINGKLGTFGNGFFVQLFEDMEESWAYRVLKPAQKLVLKEFIRKYRKESSGDTKDISKKGFAFTLRDCTEIMSPTTFYTARDRICEVGFFSGEKTRKPKSDNLLYIFVPSGYWRLFTPDKKTKEKLEKAEAAMVKSIEQDEDKKEDIQK